MPQIYFQSGPYAGKKIKIGKEVIIGRLKSCHLTIRDEELSRKHSRIFKHGPSYFVEDLQSRNGTFLNGEQIKRELLKAGDVITLGGNDIVFEPSEKQLEKKASSSEKSDQKPSSRQMASPSPPSPTVPSPKSFQGTKIAGYEVREEFFASPLYIWHHGWQESLHRRIAFQFLSPLYASQDKVKESFLKRARQASRWTHPHLMEIFDVGEEEGLPFAGGEELEGVFLTEVLQAGEMELDRILELSLEFSSCLTYLHQQGASHGNLSLDTLFINTEGHGKVVSASVSPWSLGAQLQESHWPSTLPYTAPELIEGGSTDLACDVYSLGAVLFRTIGGEAPFSGAPAQLRDQCLRRSPRQLTEIKPSLPIRLDAFVSRMLSKKPSHRPTMEEVEKEIREIFFSVGSSEQKSSPSPVSVSEGGKKKGKSRRQRARVVSSQSFSKGEAIIFAIFLIILFFLSSGITRLILTLMT